MLTSTIFLVVAVAFAATPVSAKRVLQRDEKGWLTDSEYFISNRKLKQSESFIECRERGDLRLVEILTDRKRAEVAAFLSDAEHRTGWTAGEAKDYDLDEYRWRWSKNLVEVAGNWNEAPDRSNPNDWIESGIVLRAATGKWSLQHETRLHVAICEKVPPC